MAKIEAAPLEYAPETLQALVAPGLLLVSLDSRQRPNVMTIGWGAVGVFWGRPVFVAPVRSSRYTHGCIEATGDFTVNLLPRELAHLASFCGSVSGRDHDKFAEADLTPAPALRVKSPIIEQCLLHYECRVVHANDLLAESATRDVIETAYPAGDYHRFFFGEVVALRAERDFRQRL